MQSELQGTVNRLQCIHILGDAYDPVCENQSLETCISPKFDMACSHASFLSDSQDYFFQVKFNTCRYRVIHLQASGMAMRPQTDLTQISRASSKSLESAESSN